MAQTVVGLAIDVSGSMRGSFGSNAEQRLQAVWRSLRSAVDEAVTSRRDRHDERWLFGCLFGLQHGEVADLFVLARLGGIDATRVAAKERLAEWAYEVAWQFQAAELQLLASALDRNPEYGETLRRLLPPKHAGDRGLIGGLVDLFRGRPLVRSPHHAVDYARRIAREEARWLLTQEITVPFSHIGHYLTDGAFNTDRMRTLVFGETPLCHALALASRRFAQFPEARKRLVVISDGEPTDGDPRSTAAELRKAGVAILSCFIAPDDLLAPRSFPTTPSTASSGAAVMTAIASPAAEAPEVADVFRKLGWDCADDARLVLQANHSRLLDDLFTAALTH